MKNVLVSMSASLFLAFTAIAQEAPRSVISVDTQKVLESYEAAQDAQAKLMTAVQTAESEAQAMRAEIDAMEPQMQELQKKMNNPLVGEEAKRQAEEELQAMAAERAKKQRELNAFNRDVTTDLRKRFNTQSQRYQKKVLDVVSMYAEENRIDIVLNVSGPGVLFASERFDRTEEIIDLLNSAESDTMN